jgi:hypothetical protein
VNLKPDIHLCNDSCLVFLIPGPPEAKSWIKKVMTFPKQDDKIHTVIYEVTEKHFCQSCIHSAEKPSIFKVGWQANKAPLA